MQQQIIKVNINEIKSNPRNPRKVKEHEYTKLLKSIKEFPEMISLRPLVIDENNIILGGNQRYKALKELGYKEVNVIYASELTDKQKEKFVLLDNWNAGDWDKELLNEYYDKEFLMENGFNDYEMIGIFGDNILENKFTKTLEGSNYNDQNINIDDFIKQNIFFFNELLIEFEDDEVKTKIRNIQNIEGFKKDLINLIKKYG